MSASQKYQSIEDCHFRPPTEAEIRCVSRATYQQFQKEKQLQDKIVKGFLVGSAVMLLCGIFSLLGKSWFWGLFFCCTSGMMAMFLPCSKQSQALIQNSITRLSEGNFNVLDAYVDSIEYDAQNQSLSYIRASLENGTPLNYVFRMQASQLRERDHVFIAYLPAKEMNRSSAFCQLFPREDFS